MEPPSEVFSGTWPTFGSIRNGAFFLRPPVALRTVASDSFSSPAIGSGADGLNWPTARTTDTNDGRGCVQIGNGLYRPSVALSAGNLVGGANLADAVQMWRTPATSDTGTPPEKLTTVDGEPARIGQRMYRDGKDGERINQTQSLGLQVQVLWQTPQLPNGGGKRRGGDRGDELLLEGQAPEVTEGLWATPTTQDGENDNPPSAAASSSPPLNRQVVEAWGQTPTGLWPTPNAEEATGYMSGSNRDTWRPTLSGIVEGQSPVLHQGRPAHPSSLPAQPTPQPGDESSNNAPTSRPRLRLNPAFVAWLMGLPEGWASPEPMSSAHLGTWSSRFKRRLRLLCFAVG
jgi:hypothetical protein